MKCAQLWYLIKWIVMPLKLISIMCPKPALFAEWSHVLRSEREERVKTLRCGPVETNEMHKTF